MRNHIVLIVDEEGRVEATCYTKAELENAINDGFLDGKLWDGDVDQEWGLVPGHAYIIRGEQVYPRLVPQPKKYEVA